MSMSKMLFYLIIIDYNVYSHLPPLVTNEISPLKFCNNLELEVLSPIALSFVKLFKILVPKCCYFFSHNTCEILQPKLASFRRDE